MNGLRRWVTPVGLGVLVAGCGGGPLGIGGLMGGGGSGQSQIMVGQQMDANKMMAKQQVMQEVMTNPDTAAWHEQREKLALAIGDRVFDKGFDRVFDSMTVAVASLGARVQNMERQSGYLAAAAPELAPERQKALAHEGMVDYCRQKGIDPAVLEKQGPYDAFDAEGMQNIMGRHTRGMTISMVRQGAAQTKVKIRFDNVYYPRVVEEYYKVVWNAVDKQMFLDKALD